MGAIEGEQALGTGLSRRQAGDEIDDLEALFVADPACAFEARHLGRTRPIEMWDDLGANGDLACFDATMTFVCGLGLGEIRRRTVEAAVRAGGGKDRRMPRRWTL